MSKANRLRRQKSAQRAAKFKQRRAVARSRRADQHEDNGDADRLRRLFDPGTPADEFHELMGSFDDGPGACTVHIIPVMLARGSSPERLASLAAALIDLAPSSLTALSFAAALARHNGDDAEADRLIDAAFGATADDPAGQVEVISVLPGHGRLADALDMLTDHLRRAPDDQRAVEYYGQAIEEAFADQATCEPRVRAALTRFCDRSALVELREAVNAWVRGSAYQEIVRKRVASWLRLPSGEPGSDTAAMDLIADLAAEFGLLVGPDDAGPGIDDNALLAYAADRSVPAESAEKARAWRHRIRYGLWRIDDPQPSPGLWCTDILTGFTRYAEFPGPVQRQLVRRAVWYGGLVPIDGVWRSTGLGARLSPVEADAAADLIITGTAATVLADSGQPLAARASREFDEAMKFGEASPYCVSADYDEPLKEHSARSVSRMAGAAIPRVLGETFRYRAAYPAPLNSSDEPLCLITARLIASSPTRLRAALLARADFRPHPAIPALLGWVGPAPDGASRPGFSGIALGTLRFAHTGQTIVAEVNSAGRFARLRDLLTTLDDGLTIVQEKRIDPVLHTVWPEVMDTPRAVSAEGWESYWIDQPLAALGDRTPRQAARTDDVLTLETMLRQFEYQAELLALDGRTGVDVKLLRRKLGLQEL